MSAFPPAWVIGAVACEPGIASGVSNIDVKPAPELYSATP
jgi:hypothetical protein